MLAWGHKVNRYQGVSQGDYARVLSMERLCTSREGLHTCVPFHPCEGASWQLQLKARV